MGAHRQSSVLIQATTETMAFQATQCAGETLPTYKAKYCSQGHVKRIISDIKKKKKEIQANGYTWNIFMSGKIERHTDVRDI